MMVNIFRKSDRILLVALLVAGVLLLLIFSMAKEDGAQVEVKVNGRVVASYPLKVNRQINLAYNGHNILKIKGGKARVIDADCRDKLCVKQRPIAQKGENIICLPHKVVLTVCGGKPSEIDGVVQ